MIADEEFEQLIRGTIIPDLSNKEFEQLIEESLDRALNRVPKFRHSEDITTKGLYVALFQIKPDTRCSCDIDGRCAVLNGTLYGQSLNYHERVNYFPTDRDLKEVEGLSCPA